MEVEKKPSQVPTQQMNCCNCIKKRFDLGDNRRMCTNSNYWIRRYEQYLAYFNRKGDCDNQSEFKARSEY